MKYENCISTIPFTLLTKFILQIFFLIFIARNFASTSANDIFQKGKSLLQN